VSERRRLAYAWAAIALAAFAWFGSQQLGSDLSFARCTANGPIQTGLIGLVALALALLGGILSHRLWKRRDSGEGHDFVAFVGMPVAGLLALAIVYQILAAFIIPGCFA
jgi:hypothetical protein